MKITQFNHGTVTKKTFLSSECDNSMVDEFYTNEIGFIQHIKTFMRKKHSKKLHRNHLTTMLRNIYYTLMHLLDTFIQGNVRRTAFFFLYL